MAEGQHIMGGFMGICILKTFWYSPKKQETKNPQISQKENVMGNSLKPHPFHVPKGKAFMFI